MGDRELGQEAADPPNQVHLTRAFWMAETPVTQAQFAVWTRAAKIQHENEFKYKADHPAENLSWREAVVYCQWLTQTHGNRFPPGYALAALPTEAEWEYACRAGTETEYWSGDGAAALAKVGWFGGNAHRETHPVGKIPANPFGLFDLHGNVWEWCHDFYRSDAYKTRPAGVCNPGTAERDAEYDTPPSDADDRYRVVRGGSWDVTARYCSSAFRYWRWPGLRDWIRGFRVCLVPGPSAQNSQNDAEERHPKRTSQAEARSGGPGGG